MARPLRARDRRYAALPLNAVFGAPSHIAVLRALRDTADGATGRDVARRSGVARQAVMNALAQMESAGIVRRRFAGRSHLFRLNGDHWLVEKGLLPLLEAERGFRKGNAFFLNVVREGRTFHGRDLKEAALTRPP